MNTDEINKKIDNITKLVSQLQEEKENLKCCGNCAYNRSMDMGAKLAREEWCIMKVESEGSDDYCFKWEYDKLTRKDRIIK